MEPYTLLLAVSGFTKNIGRACTARTSFEQPYSIAQKFATLDIISGGRSGWDIVTSGNETEALNFGKEPHLPKKERYKRAGEFIDVVPPRRLDDAQGGLLRCARQGARQKRLAWQTLSDRLGRVRPALVLRQRREVLGQLERRLREQARRQLEGWRSGFGALEGRLRLLGPEQVLARGYSITTNAATGKVLRQAGEVKAGQRLKTRLKAGEVFSRAEP